MQNDHGWDRGYNQRPNENPGAANGQGNGIIEHIAITPFRLACLCPGSGEPALETRRANVLGSQLQIAESTDKAATALAASLKSLVGMEKTGCLVRKRGGGIGVLANDRPDANLKPLLAVNTGLPFFPNG
jgi:hypothetical protein